MCGLQAFIKEDLLVEVMVDRNQLVTELLNWGTIIGVGMDDSLMEAHDAESLALVDLLD
jgi:hypothetical protein